MVGVKMRRWYEDGMVDVRMGWDGGYENVIVGVRMEWWV